MTSQTEAPVRLGASFWRLFTSSSTSNLSDGILQAALPLLAATLTRDPVAVSVLGALAFLPWLLFALPAGTLVDRVNRRTAMAGANTFRGVMVGVLAVSVVSGHASLPILYAVAFLLGCAETVYDSAARAMLPGVVTRGQLERGNSLLSTAESVGNIFLGAPVGAWLFAVAIAMPLWVNGTAYLLAALLALTVVGQFRPVREAPTSVREDMAEGLRWLANHRLLRQLMVATSFSAIVHSLGTGILVLYALQNLGLSERGFGLMLAAAGVGAIVGAMVSPAVTRLLGRTNAMGAAGIAVGVAVLLHGVVAARQSRADRVRGLGRRDVDVQRADHVGAPGTDPRAPDGPGPGCLPHGDLGRHPGRHRSPVEHSGPGWDCRPCSSSPASAASWSAVAWVVLHLIGYEIAAAFAERLTFHSPESGGCAGCVPRA